MENQLKDSAVIADVLKDVRGQFFWWGGYAQFQKMPCDLEFNPFFKDKNLIKIWVSPLLLGQCPGASSAEPSGLYDSSPSPESLLSGRY